MFWPNPLLNSVWADMSIQLHTQMLRITLSHFIVGRIILDFLIHYLYGILGLIRKTNETNITFIIFHHLCIIKSRYLTKILLL